MGRMRRRHRIFLPVHLLTLMFFAALSGACLADVDSTMRRAKDAPPNWPWRGFVLLSNGNATPSDIALLKEEFAANAVRLTLKPKHLMAEKRISVQESWQQTLDWADRMLDACRENRISAVLSFSQLLYEKGIDEWEPDFWEKSELRKDILSKVEILAKKFSSRGPELCAYEFLTEPVVDRGTKKERPAVWPQLMVEIITTVRAHDTDRFISITPGPGALPSGYRDFVPLKDPHIVYSAHMYYPHGYTHQGIRGRSKGYAYPGTIDLRGCDKAALEKALYPLSEFQRKNNCFVWISEFSVVRWAAGTSDYLTDLVNIFNRFDWGWTYFNFGGYHAWDLSYNSDFSPDDPKVFNAQKVGSRSERWILLRRLFQETGS